MAVTWLMVYPQLKIIPELGALGGRCRQRLFMKRWWFFELLSIIHTVNFVESIIYSYSFLCSISL